VRFPGVDNCNEQQTRCTDSSGQLLEGQSFFCVSLNASGIEDMARTIITAAPIIYSSRLPASKTAFPQVQALVADSAARESALPFLLCPFPCACLRLLLRLVCANDS
jgi:Deoxyribonuclease II